MNLQARYDPETEADRLGKNIGKLPVLRAARGIHRRQVLRENRPFLARAGAFGLHVPAVLPADFEQGVGDLP